MGSGCRGFATVSSEKKLTHKSNDGTPSRPRDGAFGQFYSENDWIGEAKDGWHWIFNREDGGVLVSVCAGLFAISFLKKWVFFIGFESSSILLVNGFNNY